MSRKRRVARRSARQRPVCPVRTRTVQLFGFYQGSGGWREWRYRVVSLTQARQLEESGDAEQVVRELDGELHVVGYRCTRPLRQSRLKPMMLTAATTRAMGQHATGAALTFDEARHVERFVMSPFERDRRNPTAGPRISLAHIRLAKSMLGGRKAAA